MRFLVTYVIPRTKEISRRYGKVVVEEGCRDSAKRWAKIVVAQELVIHAAMVIPYRCEVMEERDIA